MLRPAFLLPPWRLLTPRSGRDLSVQTSGPATGRSGAYPDGTCTRWTCAAESRHHIDFFRTHHGFMLKRQGREGNFLVPDHGSM